MSNSSNQNTEKDNPLPSWGWRAIVPEMKPQSFFDVIVNNPMGMLGKAMSLASAIGDELGNKDRWPIANALALLSEDMQGKYRDFYNYLTAQQQSLDPKSAIDGIDEDGQLNMGRVTRVNSIKSCILYNDKIDGDNFNNHLKALYIKRILEAQEGPFTLYQEYKGKIYTKQVDALVLDDLLTQCLNSIHVRFEDFSYRVSQNDCYYGSGPEVVQLLSCFHNMKTEIAGVNLNLCASVSENHCTLGQFGKTFGLDTFHEYTTEFTEQTLSKVAEGESFNVLCVGPHGTGKTEWCKAIGKELAKEGFAVFLVNPDYLDEFIPPSYIRKICIISNEVASFMREREGASDDGAARTSRMLSFLDGNAYSYVVPYDNDNNEGAQTVIKLLTCNSVDKVDPAALRKGRIDYKFTFSEPYN